eukprot:PhF_6_TR20479/c0_g1_i3/m.29478
MLTIHQLMIALGCVTMLLVSLAFSFSGVLTTTPSTPPQQTYVGTQSNIPKQKPISVAQSKPAEDTQHIPPPPLPRIAEEVKHNHGSASCGLSDTIPATSKTLHFPNMPQCALDYFEQNFQKTCSHALRNHVGTGIPNTPIQHTYMVHYTPWKQRREVMKTHMALHNLTVDWTVGFDKEELT